MSERTDRILVTQAQSDPQAFAGLYDKYFRRIYAFIYLQTHDEALTKDITAATFEKALQHLPQFEWREVSFAAWLYRIARNELGQHRRRQRFLAPILSLVATYHTDGRAPETAVQKKEAQRQIQQALALLSAKDREIITLRFFDDLSSQEVAQILDCSTQQVYLRLHRALKRLRQKLDAMTIIDEVRSHVAYE